MVTENALDLADIAFRPEDDPVFRMSQLLLLLDELQPEPTTLDRLTYYDFFAESPYLLFTEEAPERTTLRLAGFESSALSYLSPAQRFVTRQERVGGDLAALVAYRLADASLVDRATAYAITAHGSDLSKQIRAMYADAYRTSARLVLVAEVADALITYRPLESSIRYERSRRSPLPTSARRSCHRGRVMLG